MKITKTLKKGILLSLVMLFLLSCQQESSYDISGHWIGYKATRIREQDTIQENFHLILTVRGDSLFARNFKYIRGGDRDSISKYTFKIENDSLITNDGKNAYSFEVVEQTNDQLVLSTGKSKLFYRKLKEAAPSGMKLDFTNKVYVISRYGRVIDTARFWENGVVEMYNAGLRRPHQAFQHTHRLFAGHDLWIVNSPELPVFMIREARNGIYELKKEPQDTASFIMNRTDNP